MPDDVIAAAPPPRSPNLLLIIIVSVAAAIGGAGGGAAIVYSGMITAHPAGADADAKAKTPATPPTIVELPRPFTANLRESGRYVQMSLGVAVSGGTTGADALRANDVALRSTVLETLSNQSDAELADPGGKKRLRQQLTKALNVTIAKSGAEYRVVDVFFTAFVVQ